MKRFFWQVLVYACQQSKSLKMGEKKVDSKVEDPIDTI